MNSSWRPPFQEPRIHVAFDTVHAVGSAENARTAFGVVGKLPRRLLIEDKPWEPRIDNGYPNVHYDAEESPPFKLWYDCCVEVASRSVCHGSDTKATLYAESHDGLEWHKPNLGLTDFRGSMQNNIVLRDSHGLGVFRDPHETDPSRKYKAFGRFQKESYGTVTVRNAGQRDWLLTSIESVIVAEWMPNIKLTRDVPSLGLSKGDFLLPAHNMQPPFLSAAKIQSYHLPVTLGVKHPELGGVASSPDGLHWSAFRPLDLANRWDTHCNMFWDERRHEYVGITRGDTYAIMPDGERKLNRTVSRTSSPTFDGNFPPAQVIHAGNGLDDQFYAQITFPYYSAYLGLIANYDSTFLPDGRTARGTPDDKVRCQIAWSPDSITWYRLYDEARSDHASELIPTGQGYGDDDRYDCFYANKPVVVGDQVRLYYMGGDGPHFGNRNTFLRLATLRMDGFVGKAPADKHRSATIVSKLLECGCEAPTLTADVLPGGSVRVAVRAVGQIDPLSGYALMDSIPIVQSATRVRAQWGQPARTSLPERCVLVFELRNATLFTFGWPTPVSATACLSSPSVPPSSPPPPPPPLPLPRQEPSPGPATPPSPLRQPLANAEDPRRSPTVALVAKLAAFILGFFIVWAVGARPFVRWSGEGSGSLMGVAEASVACDITEDQEESLPERKRTSAKS